MLKESRNKQTKTCTEIERNNSRGDSVENSNSAVKNICIAGYFYEHSFRETEFYEHCIASTYCTVSEELPTVKYTFKKHIFRRENKKCRPCSITGKVLLGWSKDTKSLKLANCKQT